MNKNSVGKHINPVHKPVKREGAEKYLLYTLLSFAVSVVLTRLFLEITGYPKLGNSELHIAHVLWGGLLLFIASLLPIILANRWVYIVNAICAGIGVGLFIDEVGKFITQSNDYFYPAAATIIYAFFLITVLIYFQVRKPPIRDARSELYRALESIEDVLDHDLDIQEHDRLVSRLKYVSEKADHPDLSNLANNLLDFISSDVIQKTPYIPSFWIRWKNNLRKFETRWITPNRLRVILASGLMALGLATLVKLGKFIWSIIVTSQLQEMVNDLVIDSQLFSSSTIGWFYVRIILEAIVSLILLTAAVLLIVGRNERGIQLSFFSLLLSLTVVNLFVFYFDQFSTIILAVIQLLLLGGVVHYRKSYLSTS